MRKIDKNACALFGVLKVKPCADGGTRHRAHKKAHGDRAQTGAQYRGYIKGNLEGEKIVKLTAQKRGAA